MVTLADRLAAPAFDSRSLQGMLSRGAVNYGSSMSANGASNGLLNSLNSVNTTSPDIGVATPPAATTAIPTNAPVTAPATTPVATPTEIGNSGNTQTDFDYWSAKNNLNRDTSQLDSDANLQNNRNQSDLRNAYDLAAKNYAKAQDASKNNYANNGLLYSGGFVQNQADIGEDYNRNTNDLATAGQRAFEDLTRQTTERKNLLDQQQLDIERQQAQAKANAALQQSLIEAQTKAMSDLTAGLTGGVGSGGTQTSAGVYDLRPDWQKSGNFHYEYDANGQAYPVPN